MDAYKQQVEKNIRDLIASVEKDTETIRLQRIILEKLNKRSVRK